MRLVVIGQSVENYNVNFKTDGMCIRKSLPDTILRILLSRFLVSFTNWLAYSEMKMESYGSLYVTLCFVLCPFNFLLLYVEFSVLCTMLHVLNGAIHEVEPRWRTIEERKTRV